MSDEETTPETPAAETPTAEPEGAAVAVADAPLATDTPVATGAADQPPPHGKKWYVVKVQSGREDSIKGNLERRIKLENLEPFVGRIVVPVEKITEVRDGKRRIKKVKK